MKKLFLLSFIFCFIACNVKYDVVRKEARQISPPGTVWLKDSLFIDQMEIRNLDYLEYLHWLKKHEPETYVSAVPDTNVWIEGKMTNAPYVSYYLTHPAYRNYPVVGVSYDQAVAFCKWRGERVMEFEKMKKHPSFEKVEYRLPTEKEWEYAASTDIKEPCGYEKLLTEKNYPKIWVKESFTFFDQHDVLVPVNLPEPNKFGCYNMIGNVSEMVSEKGILKGGNVLTPLEDCAFSNSAKYTVPAWFIGFRCVCIASK